MDPSSRTTQAKFNDMTAYLGDVASSPNTSEKAYVSPEGKFSAKSLAGSKTLKAQDVSELLHNITTQAETAGILKGALLVDLNKIVKGLEALKIKAEQSKTPPIIKFILELFGVEDKPTKILNQIERTLTIVKKISLAREIPILEKEIATMETDLQGIKKQLDKVPAPSANAQKLKTEIEELKLLTDITALKRAVERTGAVKGAKDKVGFFSSKTDAQQAYQAAKENLENVPRSTKELATKQAALPAALKEDEASQQRYESVASPIQKRFSELASTIGEKKISLESKQGELNRLEQAVSAAPTRTQIGLKPKGAPAKSAAMDLLDNCPKAQQSKARSVKSLLSGNENPIAYLDYQQRTIFGFSVGQRHSIDYLVSKKMPQEDLEKLLEGGDDVANMFYLATSLEQQIQSARSEGKPEAYIRKLEGLYKDMMRSLPLALEAGTLDKKTYQANTQAIAKKRNFGTSLENTATSLSDGTKAALLQMNPGERLFVPIGTQGHATLLVFEKGKNGVVTPSIYNTGEGAELFESTTTGVKNLFRGDVKLPTSVRYPSFTLTEETDFKGMFGNIFKNRVVGGEIKELYDHASQDLGTPAKGVEKKVQISGVCSFQVLTEVTRDILGEDHDQFQHDFLTQIGKEFKAVGQSVTIENSGSRLKGELSDREKLQVIKDLHGAMLEDNDLEIQRLETKIATRK